MAKNKNDYFKLIEQQAVYCIEASTLLSEILCNYSALSIPMQRDKIHEVKRAANGLHYDILSRLSKEFITPIDQEDILRLVQIIDDITDALDEVIHKFYMFNVTEMPHFVPDISKVVNKCVKTLYNAVKELKNFKKPEKILKLLVEVNSVESEAHVIFADAIHNQFATVTDSKKLISHKAIYESLKDCCDQCEHAADVIEQIIIKNT